MANPVLANASARLDPPAEVFCHVLTNAGLHVVPQAPWVQETTAYKHAAGHLLCGPGLQNRSRLFFQCVMVFGLVTTMHGLTHRNIHSKLWFCTADDRYSGRVSDLLPLVLGAGNSALHVLFRSDWF